MKSFLIFTLIGSVLAAVIANSDMENTMLSKAMKANQARLAYASSNLGADYTVLTVSEHLTYLERVTPASCTEGHKYIDTQRVVLLQASESSAVNMRLTDTINRLCRL
tara:strand:+ start:417 stop:740 length:324 start_codon:yes stop_codon:yes gene_type:complete